jgi:hypothetical protein
MFEPYELIKGIYGEDSYCFGCAFKGNKRIHNFKLDNLRLIEEIAKEKGLV